MKKYRIVQYGDFYFPQIEREIDVDTPLFGKPKKEMAFVFVNIFGGIFSSYYELIAMFYSLNKAKAAIKKFPEKTPNPIYHEV